MISDEVKEFIKKLKIRLIAKDLFLYNNYSIKEICTTMDISERKVYFWKNRFNWEKRKRKLFFNQN